MTTPEVTNSSPIVDGAIDSHQPVRNQNLQMVGEHVRDQLRQLTLKRQEIAPSFAIIKRIMKGLALLHGRELPRRPENGATAQRKRRITHVCRGVLGNRADTPIGAGGVYANLEEEFPYLCRLGNHDASLVTILNKVVQICTS
jgi:hypothetical protein